MNRLLALAAGVEAATGLVVMLDPPIVTRLLLGAEVSGVAIALGRLCGIGLFAFGMACWPNRSTAGRFGGTSWAMLTYSLLCALYLLYLGIGGEWAGRLLWPAVIWHGAVAVLLTRGWREVRKWGFLKSTISPEIK